MERLATGTTARDDRLRGTAASPNAVSMRAANAGAPGLGTVGKARRGSRGAARAARLVPETRRTWDSGLVVGRRLGPENEEGPKSGATPRPDSREQGSAAARLGSVQGSKTPGWLVGPSLRSPRQPHGSSREWAARNAQLTRVALNVWLVGPNSICGRWNVLPGQVWPPPSTR